MRFTGIQVLASSLLLAAARADINNQLWYPIKANGTTLASGTSTDFGVRTLIACATLATPSAPLFCYDRNTCSLSDVKLPAGFDDSIYGPAVSCWTKYATNCMPPFVDSPGLGCFYYSSDVMDFGTARETCLAMNADLPVPDDALAFFDWIQATLNDTNIWIGTRFRKWLDSRSITAEEWAPSSPNGPISQCAVLRKQSTGIYRLDDEGCGTPYPFVCEFK